MSSPLPTNQVLLGPCEDILRDIPDSSIDAIIQDPPYGLGNREPSAEEIDKYLEGGSLNTGGDFMGAKWEIPSMRAWREMFRVLKPGAPMLNFASTRTWDLISAGAKAAGFLDHPQIVGKFGTHLLSWTYGQGMPKSTNLSKAIDKHFKAKRPIVGPDPEAGRRNKKTPKFNGTTYANGEIYCGATEVPLTAPATEAAKRWEGYGTGLKPAWEPIICLVKPGPLLPLAKVPDVPFMYCAKANKSETNLKKEAESIENDHPCKKPLAIMSWCLSIASRPNQLILDCYAGSGSTLHAAILDKRDFIGIEKSPKYYKLASDRVRIIQNRKNEPILETDDQVSLDSFFGDL